MKVNELIEILKIYPKDKDIYIFCPEDDIRQIWNVEYHQNHQNKLTIIPGCVVEKEENE